MLQCAFKLVFPKKNPVKTLATAHAPVGGIWLRGRFFPGGRFIENQHVAQATPAQKAQLEWRREDKDPADWTPPARQRNIFDEIPEEPEPIAPGASPEATKEHARSLLAHAAANHAGTPEDYERHHAAVDAFHGHIANEIEPIKELNRKGGKSNHIAAVRKLAEEHGIDPMSAKVMLERHGGQTGQAVQPAKAAGAKWPAKAEEKQGGGLLDEILNTPTEQAGASERERLAAARSKVRDIQEQIRDWSSRKYKGNSARVSANVGDEHSGETTVGEANERRRAGMVRSLERQLAEAKQEAVRAATHAHRIGGMPLHELTRDEATNNGSAHQDEMKAHRAAVEQALAAGKPVPPEVLADYPDLAAKAKPAEEPQRTPIVEKPEEKPEEPDDKPTARKIPGPLKKLPDGSMGNEFLVIHPDGRQERALGKNAADAIKRAGEKKEAKAEAKPAEKAEESDFQKQLAAHYGKYVGSYKMHDIVAQLAHTEDNDERFREAAEYFKKARPDLADDIDAMVRAHFRESKPEQSRGFGDSGEPVNYAHAITIAADDVSKLRKSDVHRVLDSMQNEHDLQGMAEYIMSHRPDLGRQIAEDRKDIIDERGYADVNQLPGIKRTPKPDDERDEDIFSDETERHRQDAIGAGGDGLPADTQVSSHPAKEKGIKPYKYRGYASTNEGGRLSVDAGGDTPEEAEQKAKAELKRKLAERESAKSPKVKSEEPAEDTQKSAILPTEGESQTPTVNDEAERQTGGEQEQAKQNVVEGTGGAGQAGRLPAGERLANETEEASGEVLPGTSKGDGGRSGIVPPSDDLERDAVRGEAGGGGAESAVGGGVGAEDASAGSAGGSGQSGTVGDRSGAAGSGSGGRKSPVEESLSEPPHPDNPTDTTAGNFRYTSRDFAQGGLKTKFNNNIAAIKTLRAIQAEGRDTATPEEQEILSKYVGWGAFPAVFNTYGDRGFSYHETQKWQKEREQLQSLLSEEEWESARRSTLNAHFTSPDIVDANWKMAERLGFGGGRFLETSAGIGYYLGMMPEHLAGKTKSSAVELDRTTGAMLKLLYPNANVKVQGFQEHQSPDNFYDLVASNVPFGDFRIHDPRYNRHQANIHDYFFLKSADKVRPGGLIMHITSTGTMDKGDDRIRQELRRQGMDLIAAIRFPGGAHKENAGTDVVTDMLILRKRLPGEEPGDDSWLKTTTIPDPAGGEPIPVNQYFADHPEQILGTLDRTGTMYHGESVNVSKTPDYEKRLADAIGRLPQNITKPFKAPADRFSPQSLPAPGDVKVGGFKIEGGKVYIRDGGAIVEQPPMSPKEMARLAGHLTVRDAGRAVLNAQLSGKDASRERAELNRAYDAFVKEHGPINSRANKLVFRSDPDSPFLLAMEKYDPKTKKATKADIFTKDVAGPDRPVEKAGTVGEALGVSMHETGSVNIERMSKLTGHPVEHIAKSLVDDGLAYESPGEGWKPAEQYLSGNVRRKLALAKAAAEADPKYKPNVEALEKVQPEDIDHTEIHVKLGAPWVPASDIAAFGASLLNAKPEQFKIHHVGATGEWIADYSNSGDHLWNNAIANAQWGTPDRNFVELLKAGLNGQPVVVMGPSIAGKRTIDQEATEAANAKVQEIKEAFQDWIWDNDERKDRLHRYYNDNFNNVVPMKYNGQHQTFPGKNPGFKLHPHIPDFVWQVVTTGKGLAAHEVGTGKTAAMICSAMELRRLGLSRKPCIACKKANIEGITEEAMKLYPGAKIISTADMFDAANRTKAIAQIATGDYDMVIMTHDHLDLLQMKSEVVQKYIDDELADLEAAIVAARAVDKSKGNRVVKALEKAKENLKAKLQEALDETKKDDAVFFEETGIDHLFVDESHRYKALPCYTKQRGLKGVPTSRSDRATGMLMRTRWLMDQNNGRGVVFATGTPISNTMAELYNIQRYLQPQELKDRGIESFDSWASTFGDTTTNIEPTATGEYKPVSRFSHFVNIPELMQMSRQIMDVQKIEDLKKRASEEGRKTTFTRPERNDNVVVAPNTPEMRALMVELQERARELKGQKPGPGMDNMLAICTDGAKGSLDMRLLDAGAKDNPDSKVNMAIRNVLKLSKEKPGMTQIIFSDMGVNPVANGFHLYDDIIKKLVAGGVPREKIADFTKLEGKKKEDAQEAMRKGEILVAIGSTEKLGTGVNVQDKLAAVHHLDCPYTPAEVEQRNGRIWRQGNENKEAQIYNYVTERSLDEMRWGIVDRKQRFIDQVVTPGASLQRTAREEDAEELTPAHIMAAASGDPRILERVQLTEDVRALRSAASRHEREQGKIKQTIERTEKTTIPLLQKEIGNIEKMVGVLEKNPDFAMTIDGKTFDKRKDADEALKTKLEKIRTGGGYYSYDQEFHVGNFRGVEISYRPGAGRLYIGHGDVRLQINDSVQSVEATLRGIPRNISGIEEEIERHQSAADALKKKIGAQWTKGEELKTKSARLKQLEAELSGKTLPPGYEEGDETETKDGRKVTIIEALANGQVAVRDSKGQRFSMPIADMPKRELPEQPEPPKTLSTAFPIPRPAYRLVINGKPVVTLATQPVSAKPQPVARKLAYRLR